VQERFSRGRFDVFISRDNGRDRNVKPVLDEALAQQYIGLLKDLKTRFGLSGDVDLALVAGLQDLITVTEAKEDPEALWPLLAKGLSPALDALERMRAEEGAALVRDIITRLGTMDALIQSVRAQAPATVEAARKRMQDTLSRLLHEQPDPVRLAQEIAILAERTDVTEELTRFNSHMAQFRSLLEESGREAVGRKLDFLIQELGREVNTIASKAMDARISQDAVALKAELEKIREQVQNIE
ncbi:MAG TPA: YicC/YloC family endoribonuclease, partial [Nitrospirota bacterium]